MNQQKFNFYLFPSSGLGLVFVNYFIKIKLNFESSVVNDEVIKIPIYFSSILNKISFKILDLKIIYDGNDIYLQSEYLNGLGKFLLKTSKYECYECKKEINSFDFYVNLNSDSKKIMVCPKCYQKNKKRKLYLIRRLYFKIRYTSL